MSYAFDACRFRFDVMLTISHFLCLRHYFHFYAMFRLLLLLLRHVTALCLRHIRYVETPRFHAIDAMFSPCCFRRYALSLCQRCHF